MSLNFLCAIHNPAPEDGCWWCAPEHHAKPLDVVEPTPEQLERLVAQGMLYLTTRLAEERLLNPDYNQICAMAHAAH